MFYSYCRSHAPRSQQFPESLQLLDNPVQELMQIVL